MGSLGPKFKGWKFCSPTFLGTKINKGHQDIQLFVYNLTFGSAPLQLKPKYPDQSKLGYLILPPAKKTGSFTLLWEGPIPSGKLT